MVHRCGRWLLPLRKGHSYPRAMVVTAISGYRTVLMEAACVLAETLCEICRWKCSLKFIGVPLSSGRVAAFGHRPKRYASGGGLSSSYDSSFVVAAEGYTCWLTYRGGFPTSHHQCEMSGQGGSRNIPPFLLAAFGSTLSDSALHTLTFCSVCRSLIAVLGENLSIRAFIRFMVGRDHCLYANTSFHLDHNCAPGG